MWFMGLCGIFILFFFSYYMQWCDWKEDLDLLCVNFCYCNVLCVFMGGMLFVFVIVMMKFIVFYEILWYFFDYGDGFKGQ